MVRFIHNLTGSVMYVEDSRVDEYLAAGHKLAADPETAKTTEKPTAKATTTAKPTGRGKTNGRVRKR